MSKLVTTPVRRGVARRHTVLGMAVAAALALPQIAAAYDFDTGSENLSFRWDNTLRVNLSSRTAGINQDMVANPNFDDGDRRFDTGTFFTRFDILSEMDLVWKQDWGALGARVSAAGWWNPAYQSSDNYSIQSANNIVNGVPSLQLTSSRSLNVKVRWSLETSQLSARSGASVLSSDLTFTRFENSSELTIASLPVLWFHGPKPGVLMPRRVKASLPAEPPPPPPSPAAAVLASPLCVTPSGRSDPPPPQPARTSSAASTAASGASMRRDLLNASVPIESLSS